MVLLSSHFLEILLKILLWWTALCTWKYIPTKQSGLWEDSWTSFWQNTSRCSHFSWIQCSKKWLGCCCASRGACPAWCTSSWEWGPPGAAVGGICHLLQWMVAREGEGSTGASAAGRHCFASTLRDELGNAQEATGMLCCARRDKRLFPDCSFLVRVAFWSDIAGLFSCCLNTVGRKDGGRHLLARSYEQLCQARVDLFRCFSFPSWSRNDSWRFLRTLEAALLGSVFWGDGEGLGKKGTVKKWAPPASTHRGLLPITTGTGKRANL